MHTRLLILSLKRLLIRKNLIATSSNQDGVYSAYAFITQALTVVSLPPLCAVDKIKALLVNLVLWNTLSY